MARVATSAAVHGQRFSNANGVKPQPLAGMHYLDGAHSPTRHEHRAKVWMQPREGGAVKPLAGMHCHLVARTAAWRHTSMNAAVRMPRHHRRIRARSSMHACNTAVRIGARPDRALVFRDVVIPARSQPDGIHHLRAACFYVDRQCPGRRASDFDRAVRRLGELGSSCANWIVAAAEEWWLSPSRFTTEWLLPVRSELNGTASPSTAASLSWPPHRIVTHCKGARCTRKASVQLPCDVSFLAMARKESNSSGVQS